MSSFVKVRPKPVGPQKSEGEERFRFISEILPLGIFEVTPEGQCLYTNTKWQEIFEMTLAESLTTELPNWFLPEERDTIWKEWSAAMEHLSAYSKECRILTRKGRIRWIHFRSAPVFHDTGIRYTGTVEEITARKTAEEALRKSEETARRVAHENAIMAEIGQIISSTLNINEVYARFAEVVGNILSFDRISISTINPDGTSVTIAYAFGTEIDGRLVGTTLEMKGPFYQEIIHRRRSVLIQTEDENEIVACYPNFLENFRSGLRSFMGIPLISRDRVVGILIIQSFTSKAYTENEMRVAERIGNQIAGAISNALLFSERQRVERTLRQTQEALLKRNEELHLLNHEMGVIKEELETTMNCLGDMILLADEQGRVKRCNQVFKEFTCKNDAEIIGRNWKELLNEHQLLPNHVSEKRTEVYHGPTGRWFTLNAYPYQNKENQDVMGSVIAIHDVTELKRIAETLKVKNFEVEENRIKLQQALNTISSMIHQVMQEKGFRPDPTNPHLKKCYEILNCENRLCPCFGQGALKCWEIVGMESQSKVPPPIPSLCTQCLDCEVYRQSLSDPVYQISEQFIKMMQLLETKNKELQKAYRELKDTQAKVLHQEKMASIGLLAAGVAHEINNPMAFISSNLGTLEKYANRLSEFIQVQCEAIASPGSLERQESVRRLKEDFKIDFILADLPDLIRESLEGAERVRKIVQGLKTFARVDEADYKYADINECIESTLHLVWNELKYKVTLKKDFGVLPRIKCYPQQLNQVFVNLLVNGAQAIDKQGEITIKTWVEDEAIFIAISDTGCGIPEENLSKIFEPFFTTKEVGKGTGLGLSIVYEIVKKHQGEITVQSEVGKGTTFFIRLPMVKER
ncbi:MAG: ATP-binding protein [Desulfobacterota bacterium]|nr:ATP-binding protein [Thermodesulfobacteriota bacterium]